MLRLIVLFVTCLLTPLKATSALQTELSPPSNSPGSYKDMILRLAAFMGIAITPNKKGEFIYDSSIPFRKIALQFQSNILYNCRKALQKQYRIDFDGGLSRENISVILDSKLKNVEGQALKTYFI